MSTIRTVQQLIDDLNAVPNKRAPVVCTLLVHGGEVTYESVGELYVEVRDDNVVEIYASCRVVEGE